MILSHGSPGAQHSGVLHYGDFAQLNARIWCRSIIAMTAGITLPRTFKAAWNVHERVYRSAHRRGH